MAIGVKEELMGHSCSSNGAISTEILLRFTDHNVWIVLFVVVVCKRYVDRAFVEFYKSTSLAVLALVRLARQGQVGISSRTPNLSSWWTAYECCEIIDGCDNCPSMHL